jgi:hypothetical protein
VARKWWVFFAGAAVGISGFVAMFLVGTYTQSKSTEAFARATANAVFSKWDERELLSRASPDFLKVSHPDQIQASFHSFAKLGDLKKVDKLSGGLKYNISLTTENIASASYTSVVEFERGNLQVQIDLVRIGRDWRIQAFRITAER